MFELRNITAGYGEMLVLRDVTLAVPPASVVALLGPNGAGKTTLLRVASGLLRPKSGGVILDGEDRTADTAFDRARARILLIPEGRGIFRSLSVRDNLVLQSERGQEEGAIEKAIGVFPRLGERLSQVAGTLSGGEQQMLALAHAYVRDAAVIMLDEVSMGLAPRLVDEIFEFLRRLAATGVSLLLVEQYVPLALSMANYVYVLNQGAVSFAGEPSELDDEAVLTTYLGRSGEASAAR